MSTAAMRAAWGPACKLQPPTRFTFWTGVPVNVDGRTFPVWERVDDIMRAYGYGPKQGQTWGYNCRKITGGSGYSLHAYGIAVDINSLGNPYGPRLITDMPTEMIADIEALRTVDGHKVVGWGGRYSRNKDAMHLEVIVTPAQLARGFADFAITGKPNEENDEMNPTQERLLRDLHEAFGPLSDTIHAIKKQVDHQGAEQDVMRRDIRKFGAKLGVETES